MPEITELSTEVESGYFSEEYNKERSSGCHVMVVVEDLEERLGVSRKNSKFAAALSTFAALGFVFERLIGKAMSAVEIERRPGKIIRPGELHLNGITGTPDGFNVPQWALEEWKCTWRREPKSVAEFEERHWKWKVQVLAYMHMIGTDTATLRVLYVMGNWNMSEWTGPSIKTWRIRAEKWELEENWQMILNHKRTMEQEGRAGWMLG